jgi:hypothetical protein
MKHDTEKEDKKYPKGYFVSLWSGLGVAIFAGIGVPLSLVLDNFAFIGIGPAIGIAVGAGIGQSIESKYEKEGKIRPLSEEEIKKRKILVRSMVGLILLGIIVLLLFIFVR